MINDKINQSKMASLQGIGPKHKYCRRNKFIQKKKI